MPEGRSPHKLYVALHLLSAQIVSVSTIDVTTVGDLKRLSVLERSLHFGPRTVLKPWIRSLMLLHLEICQPSRPWECRDPEGISKACEKGGKPASWLSTLCHFHGLLWKRVSQNQNHGEGPFWEREPFDRAADYLASALRSMLDERIGDLHYSRSQLFHRLLEEAQGVGPGCLLHERHSMI